MDCRLKRFDGQDKIWYELLEPCSRLISTYLTNAFLHADEHSIVSILGEWPSQRLDNTKIDINAGVYRIQVTFTCQEPLGEDQCYMPQFDGAIFDTDTHEVMKFVLREYDDIIDGIIFCANAKPASKFVREMKRRYYSEVNLLSTDSDEFEYQPECARIG